jgi:hypothetical protein
VPVATPIRTRGASRGRPGRPARPIAISCPSPSPRLCPPGNIRLPPSLPPSLWHASPLGAQGHATDVYRAWRLGLLRHAAVHHRAGTLVAGGAQPLADRCCHRHKGGGAPEARLWRRLTQHRRGTFATGRAMEGEGVKRLQRGGGLHRGGRGFEGWAAHRDAWVRRGHSIPQKDLRAGRFNPNGPSGATRPGCGEGARRRGRRGAEGGGARPVQESTGGATGAPGRAGREGMGQGWLGRLRPGVFRQAQGHGRAWVGGPVGRASACAHCHT